MNEMFNTRSHEKSRMESRPRLGWDGAAFLLSEKLNQRIGGWEFFS